MEKKYSRISELLAVPKYRSLFKLGGYLLFFVIFFIFASFNNNNSSTPPNYPDNNSYGTMKTNVTDNNVNIKYNITAINDYYIEGTITNDVFNGILEIEAETKKIKITNEKKYIIQKGTEIEDESLLNDINTIYLFPKNIMNILNENKSIMKQSDDNKIFSYLIDGKAFSVYTDSKRITKIIILDDTTTYELIFDLS